MGLRLVEFSKKRVSGDASMNEETIPVIIAGAGPVGLAFALGLARQGTRSVVLEKKNAVSDHSKALLISTRTLEILRAWNALERFRAEGQFVTQLYVWLVGKARPQIMLDFAVLADQSAITGVLILSQDRTEALLLEEVQKSGMCDVRFGQELVGFHQDERGVSVQVKGEGTETYDLRGYYLVGCDGAHSSVRQQLGWKLEGKTYPARVLIVDVRITDERDKLPWPRITPRRRGAQGALRFAPQEWRIISTMELDEAEDEAISDNSITRKVNALFGEGPYERIWASAFHIHCRTSPHFRLGRVLLAGDAAHINSPAGGQGMNSGIQDAHNLAWKLARALNGGDADKLLTSYEQERRGEVVRNLDRFTDLLTRFMLTPLAPLRNLLLSAMQVLIARPGVMKRALLRMGMLTTRYGSSALISGEGKWLGAQPPDCELIDSGGAKCRLSDLTGTGGALLLFEDGRLPHWDQEQIVGLLRDLPNLNVTRLFPTHLTAEKGALRDAAGELWKTWAASGDTAVLLRPDGFVGWRAKRPAPKALRAGVVNALGDTSREKPSA